MFLFTLQLADGTPADPPQFRTSEPNWRPGHVISLGRDRSLEVVDVRAGDGHEPPVLVVEDLSETATTAAG